jgi:hypothetical protein
MILPSQVKINSITAYQIGLCAKVFDCQTGKNFYQVENEAGNTDADGNIIEYKVTYSSEKSFQCSCEAGKWGFTRTKLGYCKHIAWAVAAANEEHNAIAEIAKEQEVTNVVERIKDEVRAEIASGDHDPVCDQCGNVATHFNIDAVEFRCDGCENKEVAHVAASQEMPEGDITMPAECPVIVLEIVEPVVVKTASVDYGTKGTLGRNKGFSLLRTA